MYSIQLSFSLYSSVFPINAMFLSVLRRQCNILGPLNQAKPENATAFKSNHWQRVSPELFYWKTTKEKLHSSQHSTLTANRTSKLGRGDGTRDVRLMCRKLLLMHRCHYTTQPEACKERTTLNQADIWSIEEKRWGLQHHRRVTSSGRIFPWRRGMC